MSFLGLIAAIMLCNRMKHRWQDARDEMRAVGAEPGDERSGRQRRRGKGGCGGTGSWASGPWRASAWNGNASAWNGTPGTRDWSRGWDPSKRRGEKPEETSDEAVQRRARRRAAAVAGFYGHAMTYTSVIGFLAFINIFTGFYPWFLWPAFGWGIGLFSHYMGVFGGRYIRENYFEPAVEREVRREKRAVVAEKQADIGELSSTIAHEIRNPIAAAKSLVQQMGEDPQSVENQEYARVAIEELDRVERRVSHLLKYAKEEDYELKLVGLAGVVDASLAQLKSKLEAAHVRVARNYIGGPTVKADAEKLQRVFGNILDNAIDALASMPENRRIDIYIENGLPRAASVRLVDNGAGIAPEKLAKIFNPFFTTKDHGTGLGMAIAKKIVDAHQGTIEVQSDIGRGTEFRVTLPTP
jgi:signal transduction histidine kinase